jgi:glycosyltransferase involved in cell wall biosynthesis
MKNVIVHYPFIARYRMPIFNLLNKSEKFNFEFWADEKSNDEFLLTDRGELRFKKINLKHIRIPLINKIIEWQPSAIKYISKNSIDIYIVLGNPNSISTWLCVLISRIRKIPVLMWSHGFLKDEGGVKGFVRKFFYKLANGHLLYGDNAKKLMLKYKFKNAQLHVIYNSLDYRKQRLYRDKLSYDDCLKVRNQYGLSENSIVLIIIGRLLPKLKIQDVIQSVYVQRELGNDVALIIIGDGAEKEILQTLVMKFEIQDKIIFYGACHKEEDLSKLYNASNYSIVMGKVGLSAMHSLAYGIPMITNDNMNEHFPEIEAVIDGETGFYFRDNDIEDFQSKLRPIPYRGIMYRNCIDIIEENYTPERQILFIENALDTVFKDNNVY